MKITRLCDSLLHRTATPCRVCRAEKGICDRHP